LNVLLAEDNVVNQRVAVGLLTKRGHRVVVANNGIETIAALKQDTFDLVLMDVQMPEMGGFEATARIRADEQGSGRRVRIVAMTARAMNGDRERCIAEGMDGYLAKPVEPEMLFAVVEQQQAHAEQRAEPSAPAAVAAPPVDRMKLLDQVDGDRELMADVIRLFLTDGPARLMAIKTAIENQDGQRLRQEAHALKGAAANLSASGLFEIAHVLEQLGAENRLEAAKGAGRQLVTEATLVFDALRQFELEKRAS